MGNKFIDKELGTIAIRRNARAKRIIARYNKDHIIITIPVWFNLKELPDVIDEMRPELSSFLEEKRKSAKAIEDGMKIETSTLKIRVEVTSQTTSFDYLKTDNEVIIMVSPSIEIDKPDNQRQILYMINNIIYKQAQQVLIPRTIEFAEKLGLTVNQVKISKSRGRWGSCSHNKNINLSYYLMMLPQKLIDYVILHELAHTIEQNHSKAFWNLLDKLCGEDSKALGSITKRYMSDDLELVRRY